MQRALHWEGHWVQIVCKVIGRWFLEQVKHLLSKLANHVIGTLVQNLPETVLESLEHSDDGVSGTKHAFWLWKNALQEMDCVCH